MIVKKFSELNEEKLNKIIDIHFNHWIKYNSKMIKENTIYKFKQLYTKDILPFGIALFDNEENMVGFCVLKIENLKKYPDIYPWLSDIMVFKEYRGKGYGKILVEEGKRILKKLGYNKIYVWTDQVTDFYKKLDFQYLHKVKKNEGGYGELFFIENI